MSLLEPSNHWACELDVILFIYATSAGRMARHASAVVFAFEPGSTQSAASMIGLPVTGTGGAFVGPRVDASASSPMFPSGEMASPAQAVMTMSAAVKSRFFPAIQFLFL